MLNSSSRLRLSMLSLALLLFVSAITLTLSAPLRKATAAPAGGFANPISPYADPDDFADPSVVYYEGYYYYARSVQGSSRIAIYQSKNLEDIAYNSYKKIVFTLPATGDHSRQLWAPELQRINGSWYIYYTATTADNIVANHRMFVLKGTSNDPQGSYTDMGSVWATNTDFYAIDGAVLQKPNDGSLYFVWSGGLPAQRLYIAPMDSPTHISGPAVNISGAMQSWESNLNEAPAFLHKNGKTFITYSTGDLLSPSATTGYKLGMLTNTDGNYLNPASWTKSSGPVFQYYSGSEGTVYAPGSNVFVKSPDGTEDYIVYHAKHFNDFNYNRELRMQKFTWNTNDEPVFGHPIPSGVSMSLPSGEEGQTVYFNSFESGSASGWSTDGGTWSVVKPPGNSYEYQRSSGGYNMSTSGSSWSDYLVQGAVYLTSDSPGVGAGILGRVVDNNRFYQLEIYNDGGTKKWHMNKKNGSVWSEIASGPYNFSPNHYYYLKLAMVGSLLTASISADGGKTYQTLGSATDSTFSSGKIGVRGTLQPFRFDNIQVQLLQ